jgi:hypothetical protein
LALSVTYATPAAPFKDEFQVWWEDHGQFCRAGGGDYERTFAFQAWRHLYPMLMQARAQFAAPAGVAVGWRLVPVDATTEMVEAFKARVSVTSRGGLLNCGHALNAAIAAAPSPAPASDVAQVPRELAELRSMLERVTDELDALNCAMRDQIDDDMAEPEEEGELCNATDELIDEARALLNGGRV